MLEVKFLNSKANRAALLSLGHRIHDPAHTFDRKPWIIIGTDNFLYGVQRRNYPVITVEDYLVYINN